MVAAVGCMESPGDGPPRIELDEIELATAPPGQSQLRLVPRGQSWWYHDQGVDLGHEWRAMRESDRAAWSQGQAPLGYGESYLQTEVSYGGDPETRHTTTYFATDVDMEEFPAELDDTLYLRVNFDDGFVFYLDGHEGGYAFMPSDALEYETLALGHEADNRYYTYDISAQLPHLRDGGVIPLAFEVHQDSPDSDDLVFDAELLAWVDDYDREGITTADGIPTDSTWLFWDRVDAPAPDWNQPGIDASSWSSGESSLGYGEYNLVTNTRPGTTTTYFRHTFTVDDPEGVQSLHADVLYDDGFVAYLNGVEIGRASMPEGAIAHSTYAMQHEADSSEPFDWYAEANPLLQPGENVLAIEVHQWSDDSSDLVFDLTLELDLESSDPTDPDDPEEPTIAEGWGEPVLLEQRDTDADQVVAAMDDGGRGLAVFAQPTDSGVSKVWATEYSPTSGWTAPVVVGGQSVDATAWADRPALAMNGSGDAVLAWTRAESGVTRIRVRHYSPTSGWLAPQIVEDPPLTGRSRSPRVAINDNGYAAVAWSQDNAGIRHAWISRYLPAPGTGWQAPERISATGQIATSSPQIAISEAEQIVAVWAESGVFDPFSLRIMASVRSAEHGEWSGPTQVSTSIEANTFLPDVVVFEPTGSELDGEALLVWTAHSAGEASVWSARFTPSGGWGSEQMLPAPAGIEARNVVIAATPTGEQAVAAWGGDGDVYAQQAAADGGWQPAVLVAEDANFRSPRLVMSSSGHGLLTWEHDNEIEFGADIAMSRFEPGGVWSEPELAELTPQFCEQPAAAINASGAAMVLWLQRENVSLHSQSAASVWANATVPE